MSNIKTSQKSCKRDINNYFRTIISMIYETDV